MASEEFLSVTFLKSLLSICHSQMCYVSVTEQEMVGYVKTNRTVKLLHMKFENRANERLRVYLNSSHQLFVTLK